MVRPAAVLLRTRSTQPSVRMAALLTVEALFDKLAEEFLTHLPQVGNISQQPVSAHATISDDIRNQF